MRIALIALLLVVFVLSERGRAATPTDGHDYPHRPVPFTAVELTDTFWRPRIEINRDVTIPYAFSKSEETHRIENFKVAGGLSDKPWQGRFGFNDSDVSKIIEGAAYCLVAGDNPELSAYVDRVVGYYAAAQEDDGFLYTLWTCRATVEDYDKIKVRPHHERWDNVKKAHQLYNVGHMYEAGVAHYLATGKRDLLDVCIKNADLVCEQFGPGGQLDPPGHQEIEIGLAKLYRVTGDEKYIQQAKRFLDLRGRNLDRRESSGFYNQDHLPVLEQGEAVGHAVRANYMYAGMADVAALTGDKTYIAAIDRLWDNVVTKKLYLTGGVGAMGHGEAYGDNYELPNRTAYSETCASIANVYWNHRMFCLHGDAKYIDVMERSLYNGVISGVSFDGKSFFYPNPLASYGEHARSPWFGCACCPSNITRFIASVGGYMYAVRDDSVYVNLYAQSDAAVEVAGQTVKLTQDTRYPWDGRVVITVTPERSGEELTIRLRIPGWAQNQPVPSDLYRFATENLRRAGVRVNGREVDTATDKGYVVLKRAWNAGDVVTLDLPMPVRRVHANHKVEADRGRVALQRGPIVYCVEHPDVPGGSVHNLVLEDDASFDTERRAGLLNGVRVITADAAATKYEIVDGKRTLAGDTVTMTAIPYYAWAHRGRGEMAVWLPRTAGQAFPLPAPTVAGKAKPSASNPRGSIRAINDQREPKHSNDHTHPRMHWWPRKGTTEWVQYEFAEPTRVSKVAVYWFDDTGRGQCRVPASCKLMYRKAGRWHEVTGAKGLGCDKDRYNTTGFDAVTTDALRLEVRLQPNWSGGMHEWRVE